MTILMALLLVTDRGGGPARSFPAVRPRRAALVNGDRTAQQNHLAVSSAAGSYATASDRMRYTEITSPTTYEWDEKSRNYVQTGSSSTEKLPTG
ncbi:MAG: hypothetical protein ACLUEU_10865 [Oscillospiraceae bacterium]